MASDERRSRGEATFREVVGGDPPSPPPDPYTVGTVDLLFGELWNRPGLTRKERRLITLTCAGAAASTTAIESHVRAALDSGDLTVDEVQEFVLHFAFYAGWPRAATVEGIVRAYLDGGRPAEDSSATPKRAT